MVPVPEQFGETICQRVASGGPPVVTLSKSSQSGKFLQLSAAPPVPPVPLLELLEPEPDDDDDDDDDVVSPPPWPPEPLDGVCPSSQLVPQVAARRGTAKNRSVCQVFIDVVRNKKISNERMFGVNRRLRTRGGVFFRGGGRNRAMRRVERVMKAPSRNVLGGPLAVCSQRPMTGFFRNGCCDTGTEDVGSHTVCTVLTAEFLAFSKSNGNDLSTPMPQYGFPGLKPGDRWCLCARRWQEAKDAGKAPLVVLTATHERALEVCDLAALKKHAIDMN